mmetsp:Transcript_816/g.2620  ORF Transcript_816/g.2620 Transcript_816/m.2620 type:complete len:273 (-) Transcript_816:267-1085(-)
MRTATFSATTCLLAVSSQSTRLLAPALRAPSPRAMAASSTAPRPGRLIDSLDEAASALRGGRLVAFPTETVYGLGADAFNEASVASIFTVKGRPRSDPLIVHVASAGAAEALVRLGPAGLELMRRLTASFWPGPLTLVAPAVPELPSAVTSGSGYVGVRVPEHALARELLQRAAVPVAAPSANRFGHVSPTRAQHVMDDLAHHPIFVLDAPPADCCGVGIESTVVKIDEQAPPHRNHTSVLPQPCPRPDPETVAGPTTSSLPSPPTSNPHLS